MSVETAQVTKCDRCGVEHIERLDETREEPFTPHDWLLLAWQRYQPGDTPKAGDALDSNYVFAFCPSCASDFVTFAAKSNGPRLILVT